jgi:hypothetical protein
LSLPLAAGLPPLQKQKGGVCSLRYAPVPNPSRNGSKGEESPLPVVGGWVGKNANIRVYVFSCCRAASCRPRLHAATAGSGPPALLFAFITLCVLRPTADASAAPSPKTQPAIIPADATHFVANRFPVLPPRQKHPGPPPLRGGGPAPSGGAGSYVAYCTLKPDFPFSPYISINIKVILFFI